MAEWQIPADRVAVRSAVRFPLRLSFRLKTEDGIIEATTHDISSTGILFEAATLPEVGSSIEFTMNMPSDVMGWTSDVAIHCTGRVVRHHRSELGPMAAAMIDEYSLTA